jgi:hypothetical protein
MAAPPRVGRKLLVASLGVAAVAYAACSNNATSGNLVAPPTDGATDSPTDAVPDWGVGNLVPPPTEAGPDGDAGTDAPADAPKNAPDAG